jgi:hypothetical protein
MTQHYNWRTENVRFSFLGCTDEAAKAVSWEKMTGESPESTTQKKQLGTRHEEGDWQGRKLVVASQPGRIDVVLAPINNDAIHNEPPHMDKLPPSLEILRKCILNLKLPASSRLAVSAQVHIPLNDSKEAAEVLGALGVSSTLNPKWTDVVYQYNDPCKLKGGIEFNRIFKWTQIRAQFVQFAVTADGQQIGAAPQITNKWLLQLELDFNTAPHAQLPHQDSHPRIVSEMFDLLLKSSDPQRKS